MSASKSQLLWGDCIGTRRHMCSPAIQIGIPFLSSAASHDVVCHAWLHGVLPFDPNLQSELYKPQSLRAPRATNINRARGACTLWLPAHQRSRHRCHPCIQTLCQQYIDGTHRLGPKSKGVQHCPFKPHKLQCKQYISTFALKHVILQSGLSVICPADPFCYL